MIFPPRCGGCGAYGATWCGGCAAQVLSLPPGMVAGIPLITVGRLAVPVVGGLTRLRPTPAQVGLSQPERQVNMLGAFEWAATAPPPRGLALVDDVCTTGATLTAAAEAVARAGGSIGAFVVLARAQTLPALAVTLPGQSTCP